VVLAAVTPAAAAAAQAAAVAEDLPEVLDLTIMELTNQTPAVQLVKALLL
jgi:hypothetical protein